MSRCNCFSSGSGGSTASLVNDPVAGIFTFNDGAGTITTVDYCSSCGGTGTGNTSVVAGVAATGNVIATHDDGTGNVVSIRETVATITEVDGVLTHESEDGTQVSWSTVDRERVEFEHRETVTVPAVSGLWTEDRAVVVDSYAITAGVAPTGNETVTWRLYGNTGILLQTQTATLSASINNTGPVAFGPWTMQPNEYIEAEIVAASGSERLTLHLYYTEDDI